MNIAHCSSRTKIVGSFRPSSSLRLSPRGGAPRHVRMPTRSAVVVRASQGGIGDFFKNDGSKQDAAKKALQDAFAGKKDPFALDEERRKKREGGGGGGGGNGGRGDGGSGFNFGDFSDGFRKWLKSTLKVIASVIAFFGAISLFYLWRPALQLITRVVRLVLRLDGNPRIQTSAGTIATVDLNKKDGLGNVEESVINKWTTGQDVGATDEESEEESEEEEEEDEEEEE